MVPAPPALSEEDAVVKATWIGGGKDRGRRKDGRPWRSRREVTEASPAPCILPLCTSLLFFSSFCQHKQLPQHLSRYSRWLRTALWLSLVSTLIPLPEAEEEL